MEEDESKSIFDKLMTAEEAMELVKFKDDEKSIEDIEIHECPNTGI